eukprot:2215702-Amphidinium_carterae.1
MQHPRKVGSLCTFELLASRMKITEGNRPVINCRFGEHHYQGFESSDVVSSALPTCQDVRKPFPVVLREKKPTSGVHAVRPGGFTPGES